MDKLFIINTTVFHQKIRIFNFDFMPNLRPTETVYNQWSWFHLKSSDWLLCSCAQQTYLWLATKLNTLSASNSGCVTAARQGLSQFEGFFKHGLKKCLLRFPVYKGYSWWILHCPGYWDSLCADDNRTFWEKMLDYTFKCKCFVFAYSAERLALLDLWNWSIDLVLKSRYVWQH